MLFVSEPLQPGLWCILLLLLRLLTVAELPRSNKRPSAVWHLARINNGTPLFSERSASVKLSKDHQLPNDTLATPTSRTILAYEGPATASRSPSHLFQITKIEEVQGLQSAGTTASTATITRPIRPDQIPQKARKPSLGLRKFHLTKRTLSAPSQHHITKSSAPKYKKSRKELAVFVERTEKALKAEQARDDRSGDGEECVQAVTVKKKGIQEPERVRKRPNATPAERKWRTDTWGRPVEPAASVTKPPKLAQSVNEPSDQWDYESPQLAEQLQQIALQEIHAQEKGLKDLSQPQLKTQPKPPKPRQPNLQQSVERICGDYAMTDGVDSDEDSHYVFDTYVRSRVAQDGDAHFIDPDVDAKQGISSGTFGIIVIDDDQEDLWETYGEDQESDAELDSEEEDENGS